MAKARQKIRRRIAVRNSPIHGRGVFALRPVSKGTRIIEYKGKLITDNDADRRFGRLHANSSHTMLFSVDDGLVIDATRGGNSARWINHSCAPNCEIEEESHRVFIEARRDIRPGEELTYDYNLQIGERHTAKAKREHACLCGARRCRGTMLGEEEEDEPQQASAAEPRSKKRSDHATRESAKFASINKDSESEI